MSDRSSLFSVEGKTALVTGASRGIGLMIARGLLEAGATVIVSSRSAETCARGVEQLAAYGEVRGIHADLSSPDGPRDLATALHRDHPKLHILVNNAGTDVLAPLEEFPDDAWDDVLSTNLKAVFVLTVALLPALRAAATVDDPARVINVGSVDGLRPHAAGNYAYTASKAGVHMLTRQLAGHLAGEAITVNAIAPGPFDTRMTAFALETSEGRAAVEARVPLGRIGRPDDMAGATIFLASRAGAYVTGSVVPVDGGYAQAR